MKKSTYLGWAIGSFTSSALVSAVTLLHLRFMTDSLGIAIGVAGALVILAKIYDAAFDPLMGHIGDRTRSRFGQFRPYLLVGGLLAALSMTLLFHVPDFAGARLTLYVAFTLLLFSTAYTVFRIPYLALGRAITQDFHERSRLMTFSVYGSSAGSLAASSAAPYLLAELGSDRAGHGKIALILSLLIALGGIAAFALLKEKGSPAAQSAPQVSLQGGWAALLSNKPFLWLLSFKVILFAGLTIHSSALPYYTRHVLGVSDRTLAAIYLVQTLAMMGSQVLWVRMAARVGRNKALACAGTLLALAYLGWALVPASSASLFVYVACGLSGVASGGIFFGLYTVLTDTMDYARRAHGEDRAGMFAGIFVMVEKATAAVGTFIFSMIMSWTGYVSATGAGAASQPEFARTGIVIALCLLPAAAALVASLIMLRYRLPPQTDSEGALSEVGQVAEKAA